jgi:arabinan endo-1,5-alpha-L-arabinosidase
VSRRRRELLRRALERLEASFTGNGACFIALDYDGACEAVPSTCTTRITYGSAWLPSASHPAQYDDVSGRVFSDGQCFVTGSDSYADLSNGWQPHFSGSNGCSLSFEYTQCGGLYTNPVIPVDCPDPGVLALDSMYVLTYTSGDAADAFPIYTSPDLAQWTLVGHVFPSGQWPAWAVSDFWAPEIHSVGGHYVVYYSARGNDGVLAVGAASSKSPEGPFTDVGVALVHDASMGHIDASEINASNGTSYALWKDDGNAVGLPTPIHAQPLTSDGLTLRGSPSTLITNDQPWEGAVTEAPFMVERSGVYYLFYSGNAYYDATYAVGVAQATSPLGPFTKASGPILTTDSAWVGPGHCSVVHTPAGDTYMVFAAWRTGCVNETGCGRLDSTDAVTWGASWPSVPLAPSWTTRPLP